MTPYFANSDSSFILHQGDVCEVLKELTPKSCDMVFADPPYFLSNGGFTVQAGKQVSVDKGDWDKANSADDVSRFNYDWLKACREVMKDDATIWVCGTFHNIYTVAEALTALKFKILNAVTWQKTNPPPNLSCRFFKHSTEIIIWARKCKRVAHYFNYDLMHKLAGDRQMTDVWRLPAIGRWEKTCGKHPTQKPLSLCVRAILASTKEDALVLDPFAGSATTGIAANLCGRKFVGIDCSVDYLEIAKERYKQLTENRSIWRLKISDLKHWEQDELRLR